MNKKGVSILGVRYQIYFVFFIIAITIFLFTFVYILNDYRNRLTAFPVELEAETLALRFLNNPDCFAYQDEITKRVYPRVIDLKKFNQKTINSCYPLNKEKGFKEKNFELNLVEHKTKLQTNNYYQRNDLIFTKLVLVKKGDKIEPDTLIINVQK